jgi:hypothetical protein
MFVGGSASSFLDHAPSATVAVEARRVPYWEVKLSRSCGRTCCTDEAGKMSRGWRLWENRAIAVDSLCHLQLPKLAALRVHGCELLYCQ